MVGYEIVNMFAGRPFAGSALAVVPEAEGLSTQTMQAIARELCLPETAFVLPPSSARATYSVRVFTPSSESPFGGHSSIGTAATLVRLGRVPAGTIVQECGGRLLPLSVSGETVTITCTEPLDAVRVHPGLLLAACGLEPEDVASETWAVGFGPRFHYLPVRSGAVARACPNEPHMRRSKLADVFVFEWSPHDRTVHARLFAPGYGMPEDPACSPVALGLGLWLVHAGWLPVHDGTCEYRILQGAELGRPATLSCAVTVRNGRATTVSVSGRVVLAARGEIPIDRDHRSLIDGAHAPSAKEH